MGNDSSKQTIENQQMILQLQQQLLQQQRTAGKSELATWTTVARVILNLDEFITRE